MKIDLEIGQVCDALNSGPLKVLGNFSCLLDCRALVSRFVWDKFDLPSSHLWCDGDDPLCKSECKRSLIIYSNQQENIARSVSEGEGRRGFLRLEGA